MRSTFVVLLLSLAVGGVWLSKSYHKESDSAPQPATTSQVSPHDWAKQALDRTAEVKRAVAKQRKENDVP